MNSERILNRADALVERVREIITDDPGSRAALRRGVGLSPEDPRMLSAHRIVAPYTTDEHPNAERAFYAVAAIMAAQTRQARDQGAESDADAEGTEPEAADRTGADPAVEPAAESAARTQDTGDEAGTAETVKKRANLGVTLAEAVFGKGLNADTTEQRLHLLARQPVDGVHRHLPRLVLHLRGEQVPVDWAILIRDLSRWGHSPGQVAKEWVQGYHRTLETLRRKAAEAAKAAKAAKDTTEGNEAA